jgi:hypothetical protein
MVNNFLVLEPLAKTGENRETKRIKPAHIQAAS